MNLVSLESLLNLLLENANISIFSKVDKIRCTFCCIGSHMISISVHRGWSWALGYPHVSWFVFLFPLYGLNIQTIIRLIISWSLCDVRVHLNFMRSCIITANGRTQVAQYAHWDRLKLSRIIWSDYNMLLATFHSRSYLNNIRVLYSAIQKNIYIYDHLA